MLRSLTFDKEDESLKTFTYTVELVSKFTSAAQSLRFDEQANSFSRKEAADELSDPIYSTENMAKFIWYYKPEFLPAIADMLNTFTGAQRYYAVDPYANLYSVNSRFEWNLL